MIFIHQIKQLKSATARKFPVLEETPASVKLACALLRQRTCAPEKG